MIVQYFFSFQNLKLAYVCLYPYLLDARCFKASILLVISQTVIVYNKKGNKSQSALKKMRNFMAE